MRGIDIGRMALKHLRGRWMIAPLLFIVIGVVCLCFAGAIGISTGTEKQKPCELTVTAPYDGQITDQTVADITQIPDVTAATSVLPVQIILETGRYTAAITLLGIDGQYLPGPFAMGGVFPDNTVMPYIVLTAAGEKFFIDPKDPPSLADTDYRPDIDWPNANISLYLGGDTDTKPVISKVCGLLIEDTDMQNVAGYIDIATAKTLLRNHNITADITSAIVRIKNTGASEAVTRQINALGYNATDRDAQLQAKWDSQTKELKYLLWMGGLCLLCAMFLLAAVLDADAATRRNKLIMLRWMGMRESMLRRIYIWQAAMIGIAGAILGILISYLFPAFIPLEQRIVSNFALPLPPPMALSIGVLCIGISVLPGIFAAKKQLDRK